MSRINAMRPMIQAEMVDMTSHFAFLEDATPSKQPTVKPPRWAVKFPGAKVASTRPKRPGVNARQPVKFGSLANRAPRAPSNPKAPAEAPRCQPGCSHAAAAAPIAPAVMKTARVIAGRVSMDSVVEKTKVSAQLTNK